MEIDWYQKDFSKTETSDQAGVNFTNILRAAFLHLKFGFMLFLVEIGGKAAPKMMLKLSPGCIIQRK
jgi:hypothetical protein